MSMRESRFWELMDDEFGAAYARSVATGQTLTALDGRTPEQALADGVAPRRVWDVLCAQMGVPPERYFGPDKPPLVPRPQDE